MKRIVIILVAMLAMAVVSIVPALADDEQSCSLSVSSRTNVNHIEVSVSVTGSDWVTVALNGTDTADIQNGKTAGFDLPFSAGPHQSVSGHVTGTSVSCGEPIPVHIVEWEPVPTPTPVPGTPGDGGTSSPSVGNPALAGHGVDDCRFFVGANGTYRIADNTLTVTVQKMGEGSRPFTVSVASLDGKVQWFANPSDPDLSGLNGIGSAVYNLPYESVLSDKSVKQVYFRVSNAITGLDCFGPQAISIR